MCAVAQRLLCCIGIAVTASCTEAPAPDLASTAQALSGQQRYLVVFREDRLPLDAGAHVAKAGGTTNRTLEQLGVLVAVGDDRFADALEKNPAVLAVGRERWFDGTPASADRAEATTYGDAYAALQWDMVRVGAPASWARATPAASVAVIDTGIADDHRDLSGQVVHSLATNICQHGGSAYPYYEHVIDFTTGVWCEPTAAYFDAHGTHVAGTIAAKRDGGGIIGVAPTAKIAAYKVFDRLRVSDGRGGVVHRLGAFQLPIFEAIVDATLRGHRVINMSLVARLDRRDRDDNAAYLAWDRVAKWAHRMGTVIVTAAGNSAATNNGTVAFVPSDLPTVISVSATGTSQLVWDGTGYVAAPSSDVLASYSNYGAAVDLAAPGGTCGPHAGCDPLYLILSSCISGSGRLGYCWAGGTSMAAPHVAGAVALVRGLHAEWSPDQVRSHLKTTASHLGDRQSFGAGLLDVDMATR